jgi:peptidoglycan-N-acetylglucosamine deacetylase
MIPGSDATFYPKSRDESEQVVVTSEWGRTPRVVRAALAAVLAAMLTACGASGVAPTSRMPTSPPAAHGSGPTTTSPPPTTTEPPSSTSAPPPPPAIYQLPDRLRGVEWSRLPTTRRLVALTFDAGSNAGGVRPILATLRKEEVIHATFFLTGRWVSAYSGLARRLAAQFSIGNHTITHPHLPALSDLAIAREVRGGRQAIAAQTGIETRPLFRFPYGESSPRALRIVNDLGFASIRWTVDTLGWEGTSAGITTSSIVRRVLDELQPGEIVLMHVGASPDGSTPDANALAHVIRAIRAHGYTFTTVDRFTGRPST